MNEQYMKRAIELAKKGTGKVNPNPLVGAVIVKGDRIIAEGYHAAYGELHAERHAFSNLTEDAHGASMYVTLEPCCHHGKQPPCTEAIIAHGIKKVYVGSDDPNALVAGKGIKQLRDAGIEVVTHVMQKECDALNPVFFHYITTKTPYVVMKYAMTADGKIACDSGASQWVTGKEARQHVQESRNALTGIMVGINTVLMDDPQLTCRLEQGRDPIRIVCDSHLQIPLESNLVRTAKEVPVIVATLSSDAKKAAALQEKGVQVLVTKEKDGCIDLKDLMQKLGEQKVDSILLEGGATLNQSALQSQIVQRIQVYIAPKIFGGSGRYTPVRGNSVTTPDHAYQLQSKEIKQFGEDLLLEYDVCYGKERR